MFGKFIFSIAYVWQPWKDPFMHPAIRIHRFFAVARYTSEAIQSIVVLIGLDCTSWCQCYQMCKYTQLYFATFCHCRDTFAYSKSIILAISIDSVYSKQLFQNHCFSHQRPWVKESDRATLSYMHQECHPRWIKISSFSRERDFCKKKPWR